MSDNNKTNFSERFYRLLKNYWQVGVAFTVTIAFFLISKDHIKQLFISDLLQGAIVVLLLLFTIVWFVAYIHATFNELEMLYSCNIEAPISISNWFPLFLILVIAFCFGVLIAYITDILIYASFAILLIIFNATGFAIIQKSILVSFLPPKNINIRKPIIEYYIGRPFLMHQLGMLTGFFIALIVSLIGHYEKMSTLKIVASCIAMMTIIMGESFVFCWRKRRDSSLVAGH